MTNLDNLNNPSEAVLTFLPPILDHYEDANPSSPVLKFPTSTIARIIDLADWPHLACDAVVEGEATKHGVLVGEIDEEAWRSIVALHPDRDPRSEDRWASRSNRSAPTVSNYYHLLGALRAVASWFGCTIHLAEIPHEKHLPTIGVYVQEAPYMRWLRTQSGIGEIGTIGGAE